MNVGYEPTIDAPIPLFPAKEVGTDASASRRRAPLRETGRREPLGDRRPLRFGGLRLDTLTGSVHWQGRPIALREDEVEVLHVLMLNAGRIVSTSQLALHLADRPEIVEERLRSLHASMRCAGVKCLPRRTNGLGYILWY
jgi:two-component system, OmpR family, response regulator QseB